MTICIAAVCSWRTPEGKPGGAIITASDRMITRRGATEYEPPQAKVGIIPPRTIVLMAGDALIHSEALVKIKEELESNPTENVGDIAELYGSFVRAFVQRENIQAFLSPAGLVPSDLLTGKDSQVAIQLLNQMQDNKPDFEAIVAGVDSAGQAQIHHVDKRGFVTCHNEVGFVAIGNGADHAESQIMASRYARWWNYANTALMVYSAKKRAEVAPGVGPTTDMVFVCDAGIDAQLPRNMEKIKEIHDGWAKHENERHDKGVEELVAFMKAAELADHEARAASSTKDQT
ncbi:MAG: hypothetical protein U1E60_29630 [Reyranellaceae bacterium]